MNSCYRCSNKHGPDKDWIGCPTCENWAHKKCVNLGGLKAEDVRLVSWICEPCLNDYKRLKKLNVDLKKVIEYHEKLNDKIDELKHEVFTKIDDVLKPAEQVNSQSSFASVLKRPANRNILVVEPLDSSASMEDKKVEVANALANVQVTDTRFSDKKIVLNFETEIKRNEAADKIKSVENISVKTVKKIKPKIMICNVPDIESKDDMITYLISRNE